MTDKTNFIIIVEICLVTESHSQSHWFVQTDILIFRCLYFIIDAENDRVLCCHFMRGISLQSEFTSDEKMSKPEMFEEGKTVSIKWMHWLIKEYKHRLANFRLSLEIYKFLIEGLKRFFY